MNKFFLSLLVVVSACLNANAQTNVLTQNFDDVSLMLSNGWTAINNSSPLGSDLWHNGAGVGIPAYNGAANSYAAVSALSTTFNGDISNWLISPTVMLNNGDVVTFSTVSNNNLLYPDRLELRLNPANTTQVGTLPAHTGDFSILLTTINPNLLADTAYYPQGYWGPVMATVSGLPGATNCRLAFRYWVTDGGILGTNSSTIGIDQLDVTTVVGVPEIVTFRTRIYPNPANHLLNLSWNQPLVESSVAIVYNSMGQQVAGKELSKGSQYTNIDISALSKGVYTIFLHGSSSYSRSTFVKI